MKKILKSGSLSLLGVCLFIACNKDKDKNNNAAFPGTWIADSTALKDRVDRGISIRDTTIKMKGEEYLMRFHPDSSYVIFPNYGGMDTGTYSLSGNLLVCTTTMAGLEGYQYHYEYSIDGRNMKLVQRYNDSLGRGISLIYAHKKD